MDTDRLQAARQILCLHTGVYYTVYFFDLLQLTQDFLQPTPIFRNIVLYRGVTHGLSVMGKGWAQRGELGIYTYTLYPIIRYTRV
jgi:hypothetical protein